MLDQTEVSAELMLVRLRSAAAQLGLSDVAARMDQAAREEPGRADGGALRSLEDQPALIVMDEVQNAEPDAVELLVGAASRLAESQRLLLIGRHLPPGLEDVAAEDRSTSLGTADLALTEAELGELYTRGFGLPVKPDQQAELRAATDGWLAAVVLLAARSDAATTPSSTVSGPLERTGPAVLASLVDAILRRLTRREQTALVQVAHLPLLDDELVAAATGLDGLLVVCTNRRAATVQEPRPWSVLIGPVADLLMARAPAKTEVLVRGAQHYAARGEVALAADLLIGSDHDDAAAELLAALTSQEAEKFDLAEFSSLTERLNDAAITGHPRVLLHLARLCAPAAMVRPRAAALERAGRVVDPETDGPLAREIGAEVARDLIWDDRQDEAEALATSLLTQTGVGEELTRARLLEVLGRATSFQKDDVHLGYAEERMQIAARIYRAHEHWSWLSVVMTAARACGCTSRAARSTQPSRASTSRSRWCPTSRCNAASS